MTTDSQQMLYKTQVSSPSVTETTSLARHANGSPREAKLPSWETIGLWYDFFFEFGKYQICIENYTNFLCEINFCCFPLKNNLQPWRTELFHLCSANSCKSPTSTGCVSGRVGVVDIFALSAVNGHWPLPLVMIGNLPAIYVTGSQRSPNSWANFLTYAQTVSLIVCRLKRTQWDGFWTNFI